MTLSAQLDRLVEAIDVGAITEQEAIEFLVAEKRGDKEAIERLRREHECRNK